MKHHTTHTVCILYFSYMTDIQANLFNIVFLVGGGIAVWSTGAALAVFNSSFSSQSLTQMRGYNYIATAFTGSLIAIFFLVRWYMSYNYLLFYRKSLTVCILYVYTGCCQMISTCIII